MIGNVLANRYASPAMRDIWSAESKIIAERRLWLAVLTAQNDLGVDLGGDDPAAVMATYEAVVDQVDLASIAARERVTRHDVKARIEEFNALAGYEHVHKGMTSRDLTENVEQLQIRSALGWSATGWSPCWPGSASWPPATPTSRSPARTHNVAAQVTTLGKRFATAAEELLVAYERVDGADRPLPAARDQGTRGHRPGHARPGRRRRGGWRAGAAGRRPPRLHPGAAQHRAGLPALAGLRRGHRAGAGGGRAVQPGHQIRLMAGHELVTEGFQPGQVGSSAMPHKMNTRSCERVNGWR